MQLEYDSDARSLDIVLRDDVVARTVQIDSGTLVDLSEDGSLISIEVIHPERQWPLQDILDEFDVDDDARLMLVALWSGQTRFPFGEAVRVPQAALAAN